MLIGGADIKCHGLDTARHDPVHHYAIHLYITRVRENLHLDSVSKNYGKRTVKYKASKMWNQQQSSLKEFSSVKYFSNKLKQFLKSADIVFTALHVMQTRYSDENSVRPSVRLSVTRGL